MITRIHVLLDSIKSVCRWFKYIWYDRDFDWVYILILERQKLVNVYNLLQSEDMYIGQEKYARDVKLCVHLIDIVMSDDIGDTYVNVKNSIYYKNLINDGVEEKYIKTLWLDDIYKDKALRLYYKIKADNLMKWWS